MNKVETLVYGLVKRHPGIKKLVKTLYQGVFDMLPRKAEYFSGEYDFKEGYFFGFHDVSPLSNDETKCLANKVPFEGRMPKKGESMEVGYFDINKGKFGEFHKLGDTYSWNYHKGCRLQWIDKETVIYNNADGDKLCCVIQNVKTGETVKHKYPIDAVYNNGTEQFATSFCYERLNRCMPGYGYAVGDGDTHEPAPADDGLYLINLNNDETQQIISLKELSEKVSKEGRPDYTHFVTHTEFSLDGRYVAFLYRVVPNGQEGKDMHKTWILVYDLKEHNLITLTTQESGSHYVWNHRNEIIASCVIDGKSCHVMYNINNPENYKIIAGDTVNSDGHQSFITDEVFITDTYPDRRRMTKLYKVDVNTSSAIKIADIYSPKEYQTKNVKCHIACDMHPRVSPSRKYVCFDSPRTGIRSLYIMNL